MDTKPDTTELHAHVWQAALAGLLHDVGKFTGRARVGANVEFVRDEKREVGYKHAEESGRFVDGYVPEHLKRGLQSVRYHHSPDNIPMGQEGIRMLAHAIRLADLLAAQDGETGAQRTSEPPDAGLVPVLAKVELLRNVPNQRVPRYRVGKLELTATAIFPIPSDEEAASTDGYTKLWEELRLELDAWKESPGWQELTVEAYFVTLLAFFRKYMSFVPSATSWQADEDDRILPDVSLYDHLKLTAAIAACLRAGFEDDALGAMTIAEEKPIAMLVRGDWSGIQNFIFRITRAEGEGVYENVAKRLRGRSFYFGLLGDVVVDWLTRQLGVTTANVLYSGGGRFDLIVPIGCKARVQELEQEINEWLLETYYGELDLRIACVEIKPSDLADMREVYDDAETILIERKPQKWFGGLTDENFYSPDWKKYHACSVCHVTPLPDPGICRQCNDHLEIGKELPRTSYLAFVQGQLKGLKDATWLWFERFDMSVALRDDESVKTLRETLKEKQLHGVVYRLNETEAFWNGDTAPTIGQAFHFTANAVPRALEKIESLSKPEDTVHAGEPLHFGAIAACSSGAERIGILKADVDRLGLIFGLGIKPASISRAAALSGATDLLFAGWLNRMCRNVSEDWRAKQSERAAKDLEANALRDQVDGLFYVMYSGGDDLFVVGPWDATLELAKTLHTDFTHYVCDNPNLTLSAGYVQVKPHYPVQRFAELAEEALKFAKNAKAENGDGRNQITAFGETVKWSNDSANFETLYDLAVRMRDDVEGKQIPRALIHDLSQTEQLKSKVTSEVKPIYSPLVYYTLTRRVKEEKRDELLREEVIRTLNHFAFIANYVSLSTRKE